MKFDLVFEGGGAKGMVFVGACEEFFSRGHSFGRLLGTSAGAINTTLLAAGYQAQEMHEALSEQVGGVSVFSTFMGVPKAFSEVEIQTSTMLKLLKGIDICRLNNSAESILDLSIVRAMASNNTSRHLLALIERGGLYGADAFIIWLKRMLD
jgi:NTE family protein